jgi:hypothetical protein
VRVDLGISALLLFAIAGSAQTFRFGLKAGVPGTTYFETGESPVRGGVVRHSSATRRYTVGPSLEWRPTARFGLAFDALYKRVSYVRAENTSVSGVTIDSSFEVEGHSFDFPVMAKHRWNGRVAPYVAGGFALRYLALGRARGFQTVQTAQATTTTAIDTDESAHLFAPGAVGAVGLEFGGEGLRLLPEFRFTRWRSTVISSPLRLMPNQVEFLLGIVF